jgi:hypothetical protein
VFSISYVSYINYSSVLNGQLARWRAGAPSGQALRIQQKLGFTLYTLDEATAAEKVRAAFG